ncbi:hypothetical protein HYALB_00000724 [Hymenoscyphus albidus]|uniref:Alcohol dehydrogenase-like C-terminal domain-containing protein n=1 Tax=Hymenoscyphus albidus TaxID=595503 RepID=A0A9N9LPF5_9HELO|nr:hypothetical protein HYALB_00000724 [Hymenoscyphus albidus]
MQNSELGFDGAFVYSEESCEEGFERVLRETGGGGIDVYYDNVGGEQLDVAISHMVEFGRIVQCGNMSQQSVPKDQRYGIKNMPLVIQRRLTINGFIVSDPELGPKYCEEHQQKMGEWIKNGEMVVKMAVTEGMENAAEGFVGMLKGEKFGKAVLKVADV